MFAVCKLKTPPADRDKYGFSALFIDYFRETWFFLHIYLDLLGVEIGPNPLIVPRRSNPLKRSAADSGVESGQRFGDGNLCGLGASKRLAAKVEFFSLSICFSFFRAWVELFLWIFGHQQKHGTPPKSFFCKDMHRTLWLILNNNQVELISTRNKNSWIFGIQKSHSNLNNRCWVAICQAWPVMPWFTVIPDGRGSVTKLQASGGWGMGVAGWDRFC